MPPKKKRKPRPTQSQKQSQRVTVNIGSTTKSAPRKKKSGGGSRQPSTYSHNLAPTFITAPPVDYTKNVERGQPLEALNHRQVSHKLIDPPHLYQHRRD